MVVAATNMPDRLDPALLRSDRFDKEIVFDLPNKDERIEIFKTYFKKVVTSTEFEETLDANVQQLAELTGGLNSADVFNIVNQASLYNTQNMIARQNQLTYGFPEKKEEQLTIGITMNDVKKAIDIVMVGVEKQERKVTKEELKWVAYHEAGHCLLAYLIKDITEPIKVSIVPRGRAALGFSQQKPSDTKIYRMEQLYGKICVLLAGRAAERLVFDHYSTGPSDDIEKITALIENIVNVYGMVDTPINFNKIHDLSEQTKYEREKYKTKIVNQLDKWTKTVIDENMEYLDKLAKALLEKETLTYDQVEEILGTTIKNTLTCPL